MQLSHTEKVEELVWSIGIFLKFEKHSRFQARSFENYQLTFGVQVVVIYLLHPTKKSCLKVGDLCRELADFNVQLDSQQDTDTKCLSEIFRSANLIQHVQRRTHKQDHILDLLVTLLGGGLYVPRCQITSSSTLKFLWSGLSLRPHLFHREIISLLSQMPFF